MAIMVMKSKFKETDKSLPTTRVCFVDIHHSLGAYKYDILFRTINAKDLKKHKQNKINILKSVYYFQMTK